MLLATALLLCGLSLAVCIKMHRLRNRRRQARAPAWRPMPTQSSLRWVLCAGQEAVGPARVGAVIENPERVLAAMEPFFLQVKSDDCSVNDDTCAICLGELSNEEQLTMLP